jgi:phospholipid/cholesterol/gamma-HCH transport system substrate-binding protein
MNDSPNKRAVIVGVFVIVGLIFLLGAILVVGNLRETFNRKIELVARFDDINGLQPGNNVWYSGVKIGTVGDLSFYGESQVELNFYVEAKSSKYIRKDAKVKVSSDGFIGNKILVIYGGTPDFPTVEEGDTLHAEKTFSSEDMINTLQENNNNILKITNDVKSMTEKIAAGEGSIGKLLNDTAMYENINATTVSLKLAAAQAQRLVSSLEDFSANLNKKGTLANELATDTTVFASIKASVLQLQNIADTAMAMVGELKTAASNPGSPVGVLLYDEQAGAHLKETMKYLESSSIKLDEDLKALQSSFLLRRYFKKKDKEETNLNKEGNN